MFTKHGDNSYSFAFEDGDAGALATAQGLKPQTLEVGDEKEFVATAQDEFGETAAVAVSGSEKGSFTMAGFIVDETAFKAAKSFTFDGRYYIITGRKRSRGASEFEKGEFSGECYTSVDGLAAATT